MYKYLNVHLKKYSSTNVETSIKYLQIISITSNVDLKLIKIY